MIRFKTSYKNQWKPLTSLLLSKLNAFVGTVNSKATNGTVIHATNGAVNSRLFVGIIFTESTKLMRLIAWRNDKKCFEWGRNDILMSARFAEFIGTRLQFSSVLSYWRKQRTPSPSLHALFGHTRAGLGSLAGIFLVSLFVVELGYLMQG